MSLRQRVVCLCLVAITGIILVSTIITSGFSEQYDINISDISPTDVYAPRQITDTVTTEVARQAAYDSIPEQYKTDLYAFDAVSSRIANDFRVLRTARAEYSAALADDNPDTTLPTNTTFLNSDQFNAVLTLPTNDFETLAKYTPQFLETVMTGGVMDVSEGLIAFNNKFDALGIINSELLSLANAFGEEYICVNKTYDAALTERLRSEAAESIVPTTYRKGQIIVRQGEFITAAQYKMLVELGFVKGEGGIDTAHAISSVSLMLIVFALVIAYYIVFGKNQITTTHISATAICSILIIIGALIVFFSRNLDNNLFYLMPLSMIPALISLLLNANIATMANVIIATLAGIQTNDLASALSIIIAGAATAYIFEKVRRRAHLLPATFASAVIYSAIYATVFAGATESVAVTLTVALYSFVGSFFGGILTIGTIPFWEAIFDVITPMKLGELSNPEHKLLKKLLLKAPGSYHHALTVANMADSAAAAINANALLARVGAYYHDIGKMENPSYFKENQFGDHNPHDDLPPEESAAIIIGHVADGASLAQQYRLPRVVRDIILQHHGTTTTSFFLYKAREKNPDVDPSDFTYPGPTPYSKEATIIMLADACEAAVRAMREKGYEDVSKIVDDIVTSRISDSQLSSSQLTFSDLDKVKASFVKTLEQYFHKRILYPQNKK